MFQPHTIATDAQGNVYVGDRANRRIQVFNGNGQFQRVIKIDVTAPAGMKPVIGNVPNPNAVNKSQLPGSPWTLCITPGPNQVLYASDSYPGRIYKLTLDGRLLGQVGELGRAPGKFAWIHGIACPSENNLLVSELLSWRVQKLTLRPTAQQRADSK
jgi:sugar lactone lactonase YvrE